MASIVRSITLKIVLLLLCPASTGTLLTNLKNLTYDELHRFAIYDQVENYVPAQKSLHTRRTILLNGVYDFCFDEFNEGFNEEWFSSSLRSKCQTQNLYRMPVPTAFNDITSNTTARNYIGWFWYQTTLPQKSSSQDDNEGKHWFIQFENVNYLALVWIQKLSDSYTSEARFLGSHVGGHLPFVLNVTNEVLSATKRRGGFDSRIRLRLTIAVSNQLTQDTIPSANMLDLSEQVGHPYKKFQPDFDFFHFAGIMGNVNLIQLSNIHFASAEPSPPTGLVTNGTFFNVCISDSGQSLKAKNIQSLQLEARLWSSKEQPILIYSTTISIAHSGQNLYCQKIELSLDMTRFEPSIEANTLTSLLDLYAPPEGSRLSLHDTDNSNLSVNQWILVDSFEVKTFLPSNLCANEKPYLQGFGMHHEQLFSGRTMSQAAIMKDIYLLKQMGVNLIRTSHYPYSSEFLDACDEFGIMVIAECQAVGLKTFSAIKLLLHKQILLEMMQRDNHRASIIMWSVANEPQSQLPGARGYFESLLRYARNDLARFTRHRALTAAIAQSYEDDQAGEFLDVIMVNHYYGWYEYTGVIDAIRLPLLRSLQGWANKHRGKQLIVSEFGADAVAGQHRGVSELFSEEYQRDFLVEYERVFDEIVTNRSSEIPFLGSMIWNFADFSTHDSLLRVGGNRKGIFTADRRPKAAVSSIREIYLNRTVRFRGRFCHPIFTQATLNDKFPTTSFTTLANAIPSNVYFHQDDVNNDNPERNLLETASLL